MKTRDRLELIEKECKIRNNLKQIQFTHYFSNQFMERYTQFFCIEEFLEAVGVTNQASLDSLPMENWERQVQLATTFSSWQEMLDKAGEEYLMENYY